MEARTAFGNLFLWDGAAVQVLLPHVARVGPGPLTRSITRLFDDTITRPSYMENSLLRGAVESAEKRAGRLEWDEMYGYEPALALGGSGSVDTIRRFKLNEHHLVLSQLSQLQPLM